MIRTLVVSAILVVVLVAGLTYLYNRHIRKQEDALAAFALSEIHKQYSACLTQHHDPSEGCMQTTKQLREYMKTHTSAETMTASMNCIAANGQREFARLDDCERDHQTAEQEWAMKYPRQAAKRQADLLEAARKRDAAAMNKPQ